MIKINIYLLKFNLLFPSRHFEISVGNKLIVFLIQIWEQSATGVPNKQKD